VQIATPGSEQVLRSWIQNLASGIPDYDGMTPELARIARLGLPAMHRDIAALGSLVSLKFTGVDPGGVDIYEAQFQNGIRECLIGLTPEGKIHSAAERPPVS
jgi:hypothetical protein